MNKLLVKAISQDDQQQAWLNEIIRDVSGSKLAALSFVKLTEYALGLSTRSDETFDEIVSMDRERARNVLGLLARAAICAFSRAVLDNRDLFEILREQKPEDGCEGK